MDQPRQYEVHLYKAGDQPQQVVEVVRQVMKMSLDEAQNLVNDLPRTLLTGIYYEEAAHAMISLENAGAEAGLTKILDSLD